MNRILLSWAALSLAAIPFGNAAPPAIAYSPFNGERGVVIRTGESGKVRKFPRGSDPAISPDGQQVVVTLEAKGGRRLAVLDLTNSKTRTLPIEGKEVYGGLWSPKGDWIAFNFFGGTAWTIGLIHPDGTGLQLVKTKLAKNSSGIFLAGWNLKTGQPLAHDLQTLWEYSVEGKEVWSRPLPKLLGTENIASSSRFWILPDGRTLIGNVEVERDEIAGADGPSDYLVMANLETGAHERISPKGLSAQSPFLTYDGSSVLFEGFTAKDIKQLKGDGISLNMHAYRMDLSERKPVVLFQNAREVTEAAR